MFSLLFLPMLEVTFECTRNIMSNSMDNDLIWDCLRGLAAVKANTAFQIFP